MTFEICIITTGLVCYSQVLSLVLFSGIVACAAFDPTTMVITTRLNTTTITTSNALLFVVMAALDTSATLQCSGHRQVLALLVLLEH
jgi:hypothetical protein